MKFVDLGVQFSAYANELQAAMDSVVSTTSFINGPQVFELESRLSDYCGTRHCIAVANGTDALMLSLLALDGEKDDIGVFIPAFSFIATASMPSFLGYHIHYIDIDSVTYNLDPKQLPEFPDKNIRGIIPVSLFGQCAEMDAINTYAKKHDLWVLEDAAQSFGATYKGRHSCNLSDVAITSFFPSKPLGCYGDGGAVFTNNDELAEKIRLLRNHGQTERYQHKIVGFNSRLDTLQAAILKVKLTHLSEEIERRNIAAERYGELLKNLIDIPVVSQSNQSAWAQYTIRVPSGQSRDSIRRKMKSAGIPTAVHYPKPLYEQEAFSTNWPKNTFLPAASNAASTVLSLPMHAFITEEEQISVVKSFEAALNS